MPSYLLLAPSATFTALIRVTNARTDFDNAIQAGHRKVFAIGGISCHEPHHTAALAEHSQGNDRSRNCSVVELRETIELEHEDRGAPAQGFVRRTHRLGSKS